MPKKSDSNASSKMTFYGFIDSLYCRFQDDEVPALSAQLTYYLILSFFPFLIFVITVLSFTDLNVRDIINYIARVLPDISTKTIVGVHEEIQKSTSGSLLSFGIIATLWSASSGIGAVIKALNKAYDTEENRAYWKVKGLGVIFTIVLAIVIMICFFMLIFGRLIGETAYSYIQLPGNFSEIWSFAQFSIPLAIMTIIFALIYAIMPNLRLRLGDVLPGAIFATVGWIVTSLLFSFYVNNFSSYSNTYGSIGGIIVLLIWLYISSIIIVLGGEINATLYFHKKGLQKPSCKKFSLSLPFFHKKNKAQ
jgi:membrane protein